MPPLGVTPLGEAVGPPLGDDWPMTTRLPPADAPLRVDGPPLLAAAARGRAGTGGGKPPRFYVGCALIS